MPDLVPTRATAFIDENGAVRQAYSDVLSKGPMREVPCLILPAPRPIAECPPEWMDGRRVWLWMSLDEGDGVWADFAWETDGPDSGDWRDVIGEPPSCYEGAPTHIMLPPPSPEEVNHG